MSKTYVNTILKRVVLLIVAFAVTALLAPNIHAASAYDEHAINFDRINNSRVLADTEHQTAGRRNEASSSEAPSCPMRRRATSAG